MNILKIRQTKLDKGITTELIEQFDFLEMEDETLSIFWNFEKNGKYICVL